MDWASACLPRSGFTVETVVLCAVLGVAGVCALVLGCYRRAREGEALVLVRGGEPTRVRFGGTWVWPVVERAEVLDLSVRKVVVERRGGQGLSCRDGIRVDLRATFLVKVPRDEAGVLRVAREVGCARANQPGEVHALLEERFACALAQSVSTFNFDELVADRGLFIDHVGVEVGTELLGFRLERMSLGRLEQTPLDQLDPTNVVDARGIQKLTERASQQAADSVGPWSSELGEAAVRPRGGDEEELMREVERALADPTRRN
ncbi:hypothetical protein CYFUS_009670 [Cystobacter fuscus]|uniref:Band 7 domain-containing protein n=1 Tax=Cystobacter fuscus TaxID=43 RepID=A0A250JKK3_9BACT|nr:hypothetical protein CYFUS_009670 [Cystobacter fuscus]